MLVATNSKTRLPLENLNFTGARHQAWQLYAAGPKYPFFESNLS